MHLEDRGLSGSTPTGKPILPVPINGQTFMFSSNECDSHMCNQSSLSRIEGKTQCSCEKSLGHSHSSSYNRLLLPAVTHKDLSPALTPSSAYADSWLRFQHLGRANYESLVPGGFPLYGRLGNDSFPALDYALLSNARRKNATRETTSTLKAWLNEHKKNPYPTKGEKVMLAIVTKMTLTQVSTWFANARRRLKKENKMTWLPKKKTGERKDKSSNNASSKSDSDVDEDMEIDISVDDDDKDIDITSSDNKKLDKQDNESVNSDLSRSYKGETVRTEIQRPSVIRAVESPTFNQIRERFKDDSSPVNSLQHWVNGCFAEPCNENSDVARHLTPPATPIENQMTTFSEQKLFEIFDANKVKHRDFVKPLSACSSNSGEPLETLFSSKQPVCSVKEIPVSKTQEQNSFPKTTSSGVITPQPSPRSESNKLLNNPITHSIETISYKSISRDVVKSSTQSSEESLSKKPRKDSESLPKELNKDNESSSKKENDSEQKEDVRVKGLTTSRELEAVLALTNLSKT